jgi:hypothetical protein
MPRLPRQPRPPMSNLLHRSHAAHKALCAFVGNHLLECCPNYRRFGVEAGQHLRLGEEIIIDVERRFRFHSQTQVTQAPLACVYAHKYPEPPEKRRVHY